MMPGERLYIDVDSGNLCVTCWLEAHEDNPDEQLET